MCDWMIYSTATKCTVCRMCDDIWHCVSVGDNGTMINTMWQLMVMQYDMIDKM